MDTFKSWKDLVVNTDSSRSFNHGMAKIKDTRFPTVGFGVVGLDFLRLVKMGLARSSRLKEQ